MKTNRFKVPMPPTVYYQMDVSGGAWVYRLPCCAKCHLLLTAVVCNVRTPTAHASHQLAPPTRADLAPLRFPMATPTAARPQDSQSDCSSGQGFQQEQSAGRSCAGESAWGWAGGPSLLLSRPPAGTSLPACVPSAPALPPPPTRRPLRSAHVIPLQSPVRNVTDLFLYERSMYIGKAQVCGGRQWLKGHSLHGVGARQRCVCVVCVCVLCCHSRRCNRCHTPQLGACNAANTVCPLFGPTLCPHPPRAPHAEPRHCGHAAQDWRAWQGWAHPVRRPRGKWGYEEAGWSMPGLLRHEACAQWAAVLAQAQGRAVRRVPRPLQPVPSSKLASSRLGRPHHSYPEAPLPPHSPAAVHPPCSCAPAACRPPMPPAPAACPPAAAARLDQEAGQVPAVAEEGHRVQSGV